MARKQPQIEPVTLELPPRILKDLRGLVDAGVYLSVEEALHELILVSWRHIRGSYHTIRIEPRLAGGEEAKEPAPDEQS